VCNRDLYFGIVILSGAKGLLLRGADVNRRSSHFGQSNGARNGFRFRRRGTGQGGILRSPFSFRQRLLHDYINRAAIFGMHADQSAVLRGRAQSFENAAIVERAFELQ
jgi:hypothetical protein